MPESVLAKLIRDGEVNSPRDANLALAKSREPAAKRKRAPRGKPVKGNRVVGKKRGPGWAYGRKPVGPLVWRHAQQAPFPDGSTRGLQMLATMAERPKAWWGRADLRRVLEPRGWTYSAVKGIVAKLLARELIEVQSTGDQPRVGGYRNYRWKGRAWRLYRATRAGRELVELMR